MFLVILLTHFFVLMVNLLSQQLFLEAKMLLINLSKQFVLYSYCKKLIKKQFHKSLIMSEEEEQFQLSNTCWICEKLIDDGDEKVRVHCHLPGKFREIALFVGFISCML